MLVRPQKGQSQICSVIDLENEFDSRQQPEEFFESKLPIQSKGQKAERGEDQANDEFDESFDLFQLNG